MRAVNQQDMKNYAQNKRISGIRERDVEAYLVRRVAALGGWAPKFVPLHMMGFPDRIVILPGGAVGFVEVKRPGGRLTPAQKINLERLRTLSVPALAVWSKEDVDEALEGLKR